MIITDELREDASNRARVLLAQLDAMAKRNQTAGRIHMVAEAMLSFAGRNALAVRRVDFCNHGAEYGKCDNEKCQNSMFRDFVP